MKKFLSILVLSFALVNVSAFANEGGTSSGGGNGRCAKVISTAVPTPSTVEEVRGNLEYQVACGALKDDEIKCFIRAKQSNLAAEAVNTYCSFFGRSK